MTIRRWFQHGGSVREPSGVLAFAHPLPRRGPRFDPAVGPPDAAGQLTLGFAAGSCSQRRISEQRIDLLMQHQVPIAIQSGQADSAGVGSSALKGAGDRNVDGSQLEIIGTWVSSSANRSAITSASLA